MAMPADSHVHSEWSWDAPIGSMERTCARAVELGLPAVAFTEHADHTAWMVRPEDIDDHLRSLTGPDGTLLPPRLDAAGYLECVQRCRDRFPSLVVLSGMEVGEPHWHAAAVRELLAAGRFDRVLGSLHCLAIGERYAEPPEMFRHQPAADAMREYLAEIVRLITGSDVFAVLAHIDYPVRYWPAEAEPFEPADFEDELRYALSVLAGTGRALEVNTRVPLHPQIVRWWREAGGDAVTFGSDAHYPLALADGLADAAAMVEAQGFRAGRHPYDVWVRG
jgi:histidinol-phosphatase (PHP family)